MRRGSLLKCAIIMLTGSLWMPGPGTLAAPSSPATVSTSTAPVDGFLARRVCTDFQIELGLTRIDIPDPTWVWVKSAIAAAPQFQSVAGTVTRSKVTYEDFPAVHDSHDMNIDVFVDRGFAGLLSDVGLPNTEAAVAGPSALRKPTTLEMEWETGTFPTERRKGAPERFFPKWAWPSVGDRVWANGHWIFDCGHPKMVGGAPHYRTEIHPIRAIASMRQQVVKLPAFGSRPAAVTATDLHIHGRAGFVVDVLNCGGQIILTSNPDSCPTKVTPIDDNFEFDIPAPSRPDPGAHLVTHVQPGPGNTINVAPIIQLKPTSTPPSVHVTIPLSGSGAKPTDVYARRIYVGWDKPSKQPIVQLRVTLEKMDLHEDQETDPGDCECTFFWMNVNRAPGEWIRLVDFARGNMNDYDDDHGFGDGEMSFSGAVFEFFVLAGQAFTVRASGYDQDCLDDHFGNHSFRRSTFLDCYVGAGFTLNPGNNDPYRDFGVRFGPPGYGAGRRKYFNQGKEYELQLNVEVIATIR